VRLLPALHLAVASEYETPVQIATPAPDKSQYTLFNPTPVNLWRPYNTDRPSKTDSPFTIDAGVFQIESDVANWTLDYENGVRTRTWIIGNANFKLGLTNWMELQIFPAILCQHAHERAWFWKTGRTRRLR
jgi:hypothetical protein